MNKIKKAPLMAFVLGLGLIFGMISLKVESKPLTTTYYYYESAGVSAWRTTAPPGSLSCDAVASNQCSGVFNSTPNGYPASNYTSIVVGKYQ